MISIDTKKKELIGNFAREGHTHTQEPVDVLEHPERWSGDIRNWNRPETVSLDPDKSYHQKKQELTQT